MNQLATQTPTTKTVTLDDLSKALTLPLSAFLESVLETPVTVKDLKEYHAKTLECLEEGLFEGLVEDFNTLATEGDDAICDIGGALGIFRDEEEEDENDVLLQELKKACVTVMELKKEG